MRKLHLLFLAFLLPLWMMAQITVTSVADSGPGTLRQAVIDIPVGGTIDFNVGGPILLTSGQINLSKDMTLDASGAGLTIDASGNGSNRIFGVYSNAVVNLINLEMTNANVPGAFGGAIEVSVATLNASNCTFRNNTGANVGGAVSVGFGTGNFVNCNFIDNTSTGQGGALDLNTNSTNTVTNCLFYNNQSNTNGGAIAIVFSAVATIINNTISDNSAAGSGGGVFQAGSGGDVTLYNNIIANNTGSSPDFAQTGPSFTANNNLIGDASGSNITIGTNGNITGDPVFFSPAGGNYRLQDQSPAINAGDASLLPNDILDVDGDGNTAETLDADLDIFPRIQACALDIGAFETGITSFYVTNTNDSGPGSLRAAIECANVELGIDDIFFDIDGGGSHTINVATVLPTITDDGIIIYGTSQPGYAGTPLITLDGGGTAEDGFRLIGDGQGILGMKIINFPTHGIGTFVASNFNIFECIITENGFSQIFLGAGQFGSISENILNIDENGVASSLDATGIWFQESTRDISVFNNTIGGLNNSSADIITMLETGSSFNIFTDNFIGTNAAGDDYGGNIGLYVQDASSNQFIRNTISFNQTGIFNRSGAQNNYYSETNFYCNENVAINMESGGNGGIQPPVITSATPDAVSGTAAPNAEVQFYFQDNDACPGNTTCQGFYIGQLTADASGNFSGPATLTEGQVITATQYDPNTLNTSALAGCAIVAPDPCDPDLDDPTITLLVTDVIIECSEGVPPILVNGVDIIAFDECDGDISANIQYVGSDFDTQDCSDGTIQIITDTYRITDANGNFDEVTWTQTRIDTEPPVWDDLSLELSLTAECGDDIDALLAANLPTATDGCDLTTVDIVFDGALATPLCGLTSETTYFYQAVDQCGNANPDFFSITVTETDNTLPVFTTGPPQNITVDTDAGTCEAAVIGLSTTATDGCGAVTITNDSPFASSSDEDASGLYPPGDYVITFTATDDCGNEEFYIVNLTVLQPAPPMFVGAPTGTVTVECGDPIPSFEFGTDILVLDGNGFDISDDVIGDIVIVIGDCAFGEPLETLEYNFFVQDACGQSASLSFDIEVVDTQAPEWDTPALNLIIDAECGDDVDAILAANLPTATDACGTSTVTLVLATSGITCGGGNASSGNYTYEAVDNCGNANPDLFTITVNLNDTQAPLLSGVPDDITIGCDDAYPDEATLFANLAAFDACDGDLSGQITILPPGLIVGCVPSDTVMYNYQFSVQDACGNITSTDFTINVLNDITVDLGPPQSVCGTAITLDAGNPGLSYEWSTLETTQTIEVTTAGTYSVTVSGGNGCCAIGEIIVTGGTAPDAIATGGTLSCATGNVQLMGSSTTPGVSYSWTGPNSFMSGDQNPFVTMSGTYTLTVTSPDGCTTTADATVDQDADVPNLTAMGTTIDCGPGPFFVTANSTTPGTTYLWTDPNGFTTTDQNPQVFALGGTYTVVATAPNGCTATAMVEAILDTAPPTITATGGALDCASNNVQLMASGDPPGGTYSWTGPNTFMSSEQNPIVSMAGDYIVTYTGTNGCTAIATATVTGNTDAPDAMAIGGTLNCLTGSVQLMGSSTTPGVTYAWTGPNMFMSSTQNPTVNAAGTYTLTVTGINGCTATEDAEVMDNPGSAPIAAFTSATNELEATFTDNSTGSPFAWSWDFGDGMASTDQNPVHDYITPGIYTVCLTVTNDCGDNTVCESVTVDVSTTGAVTFNIGTVTGQPGQIAEIPVSVENFTDIVSFQKSIHVADPSIARLVGVNNFNLSELDNSDFNLASDETITSVWFSANGVSVADGEVIYTIRVELLSTVDECTAVFMDDSPTFVEVGAINGGIVGAVPYVLNAGEACILAKVDILGKVYRETGAPLDEVIVDCTGQPSTMTDAAGDYEFLDLTAGQPYTVTPMRNTNHVDGVTALDLALIQRHILNVQMLDSPYKIIAADVDVSGLVSGIDLVKIQQLILNITTEFPDFNSWRFVDQEYTFLNPANPLQEAFPEEIDFVSLDRDTMGNDFIAMKLGDVNNTAMGLQAPNGGILNLVITETTDVNGDVLISFRSAEHTTISAYQFDIWFDQYQMQLAEVIPGSLPGLNETFFGRNHLDEGLITTLWYDPTAQIDGWELEADEVLFTLKFAASNISTSMEERIQTNVATMRSAGYTNTGEALDIHTDYRSEVTSTSNPVEKNVSVEALKPNPFVAEATLTFFLPEAADVEIQLMDISGKQIVRQAAYYPAGQQTVQLDGRDLPAAGMYYLVFKAGAFTTTQKVVLQK
jgi:PKD repeat protein